MNEARGSTRQPKRPKQDRWRVKKVEGEGGLKNWPTGLIITSRRSHAIYAMRRDAIRRRVTTRPVRFLWHALAWYTNIDRMAMHMFLSNCWDNRWLLGGMASFLSQFLQVDIAKFLLSSIII